MLLWILLCDRVCCLFCLFSAYWCVLCMVCDLLIVWLTIAGIGQFSDLWFLCWIDCLLCSVALALDW